MNKSVYADFNNADEQGRVRLNTDGTLADLKRYSISLSTGQRLMITDGEMGTEGIVEFSDDEQIWVLRINCEEK